MDTLRCMTAAWTNDIEAAKILLSGSTDPGIKNMDGLSAYELAVKEGKEEIAECIKAYSEKKEMKYR
jgi:ankyrin repeat protein